MDADRGPRMDDDITQEPSNTRRPDRDVSRSAPGDRRERSMRPERPERQRRPRVQLDIDQIVDAAMEIADQVGPDAMTMRAIASKLDVGVMSLYWYVPTKRDLEALVLERLMKESSPPFEPTGDWREDLASIARVTRTNMLRHPWMVDLFSSAVDMSATAFGHGLLRHLENSMRMVEGLPFDFQTKMTILNMIDHFTMGFTFDEVVDRRRLEAMGLTERELQMSLYPRIVALLDEHDYPLFRNFMQHDHELPDKNQQFESALNIILDGVAVQLERAGIATSTGIE